MNRKLIFSLALTLAASSAHSETFPDNGSQWQVPIPRTRPVQQQWFIVGQACPQRGTADAGARCTISGGPQNTYKAFGCYINDCAGNRHLIGWVGEPAGNFTCDRALRNCASFVINWARPGHGVEWEWTPPARGAAPGTCGNPAARRKNPAVAFRYPHQNCPCPGDAAGEATGITIWVE